MATCPDIAPLAQAVATLQRVFEDFSANHVASEAQRARDFEAQAAATRRQLEEKRERARQATQALAADRAAFEAQRAALDNTFRFPKQKVKLDVGGKPFSTTISTLCAVPGSLLAAMFSGRYSMHASADGSFFVDRDGSLFHHILNYLRAPGQFQPPADRATRVALWKEAEYFKIYELWPVLFPGQPQPPRPVVAPPVSHASAAHSPAHGGAGTAADGPSSRASLAGPSAPDADAAAAAALASARVAAIMAGEGERPAARFSGSPVVVPRPGPGLLDDTYESDFGGAHAGEDVLGPLPAQCGHGEELGRPLSDVPSVFTSAGITPDPMAALPDQSATGQAPSGAAPATHGSPFALAASLQPLTSTPSRPFAFPRQDTDTSGNERYPAGSAAVASAAAAAPAAASTGAQAADDEHRAAVPGSAASPSHQPPPLPPSAILQRPPQAEGRPEHPHDASPADAHDGDLEAAGDEPDSALPAARPGSSPPVAEGDELESTAAPTNPVPTFSSVPPPASSAPPPLAVPPPLVVPLQTPNTFESAGSSPTPTLPASPSRAGSVSATAVPPSPPPSASGPASTPASSAPPSMPYVSGPANAASVQPALSAPPPLATASTAAVPPAAAAPAQAEAPSVLSPVVKEIKDTFDATLERHRGQGGAKVADIEKKLDAFYQRPSVLSADTLEAVARIASCVRHNNSKQALQHYQNAASKLPLAEVPTMTAIKSLLSLASKKK